MNKDMILRVAQAIEDAPEHHFDMRDYFDDHMCGTTACIAGWAILVSLDLSSDKPREDDVDEKLLELDGDATTYDERAANMFGIDGAQAQELFHMVAATRDQAIRTLRNLAETGEVNWEVQ